MAESAVKLTANWLGKVLVEEGNYLWGAEGKVAQLRNELLWMQRFLKKAESLENKDEIVDQWVLQIKEYVSEAEDIVDDFIIDVVSQRRQVGWVNKLKRWSCILMELWALHQVASGIDSLTLKVSQLTPKLTTYGVNPVDGLRTYRNQETLPELEGQRMSYAHLENKKIIGLIQDTKEIVGVLKDYKKEKRRVVAIYGMGGLGKTTLATNVYYHVEIKNHFMYCAWVYISKQFQFQSVLQTLLANLTSKSTEMFSGKKVEALIKELCEFLHKNKCLVVLDDVWETKVWDSLEAAFPRDGGESGSKVLITTRKEDVAKHADPFALPKPERLRDDDSWKLLKHTLGWVDDDNKDQVQSQEKEEIEASGENGNSEVQTEDSGGFRLGPKMFGDDGIKVEKLGMEMVKNCNGIPLAIVVLGGILRKKESLEGWRLVSENISSYLRRGNDHGKSYMEVLVLSYTDLPYHLKPCFLHLGNYPEDYEIQAEKLYRMWVAEGLITWPYDRLSSTESLEDIANEYLGHLAQAGMVQIMKKASDGRIRSIRMHDLMRDVCLQKAATENFFSMIDHRSCPDEPQSLSSSMNHARLLHMAIYLAEGVRNYLPDFLSSKSHKYVRSLLFFEGQEVPEEEVQQWMKSICNDFPWMRVLDIEGLRLKGRLTKDVQKMKHLRYLSLKGTNVSELPSSIGKLMFLQTLDLRVSVSGSTVKIPNTLWRLERLRHLFLPKKSYEIKKSKFLCLHTLRCLEILKNLEVGILKAQDLQKLRKLKKLSIKDFAADVESIKNIVNSPAAKSSHLRSCSLCVKGNVIDADPRILSRFDCLRVLKVKDKLSCLEENVLPQSLTKLYMESCELKNDPMIILGSLRHLKHFSLGYNSFVGKMMVCRAKSFPHLINLNLQGLANLEDWTLEKESMCQLKKLIIMDCGKLERIPDALPQSVQVTCSPCISGIEKRGTCNYYGATFSVTDHQEIIIARDDDTRRLVKLVLDDQNKKLSLVGPCGVGKTTLAKGLFSQPEIKEKFGAIAWVRCPHRRLPNSPTHFIKGLLRQLDPVESSKDSTQSPCLKDIEDVMRRRKCLIILSDLAASSEELDGIFGASIPNGSKIMLTIDKVSTKEHDKVVQLRLKLLSEEESFCLFQTILGGSFSSTEGDAKEELGKNLLELCSGHPQRIKMLAGLLRTKKSFTEWQNFHDKVVKEAGAPQPILYALCFEDLPPYLKDCLLYLANFPENTEIPTRKLYQVWIAAGLVSLKEDRNLSKRRKEGSGEVEKLLENVAASYLNELVMRGMVQVEKRGYDKRICTCHLHISLRSFCLHKAEEKGFVFVRQVESSTSASTKNTGIVWKDCLLVPLQSLWLGKQSEERVPAIDQPQTLAQASNETVHLAVYLNQSGMEILDHPTLIDDQLKSLLFFPEVGVIEVVGYNWQCFIKICDHFRFLQVLDLEGMQMIKGALPEEVGKLSHLRYLSLKGTHVNVLPPTIQQLSHLQTLDLRTIPLLLIPGDAFRFHHLRHLYLPDSFSLTTSSSSKLQLGGCIPLQTLANLHTEKVDLDFMSELKNLRRVSVNHIHEINEFDDKLKSKGTAIELSIKSDNLNSTVLSSSINLKSVTIKGEITRSLTNDMFPLWLKELKLKHTALLADPVPILRQLPGLTHLFFDHDSFLGKKMTFSVGFPRLNHLTLRMLSILEELDMSEADHLRHIEPLVIDCWRLEVKQVKLPTGAEIEVGPLVYHPLMELLQPVDLQKPSPDNDAVHDGEGTTTNAAEMLAESERIELESELIKLRREELVDDEPSEPIGDSIPDLDQSSSQDDGDK